MVWIALAVSAVAVAVALTWWLRRDRSAAQSGSGGTQEAPGHAWGPVLDAEAGTAFTEGLRAFHDEADAPLLEIAQAVVVTAGPPRAISLHLMAEAFAARGEAALHDPEGTVRDLVAEHGAAEGPGVLHLRAGWLSGTADGMDGRRFAEAVREIVCAPPSAGITAWKAEDETGLLLLTVRAPAGGDTAGDAENTVMIDLARVLDRYREAREEQAGAPAEALLRAVVSHVVASGGPGLTWTRPPTAGQHEVLLSAATAPAALR
ncbi:hypothetical protein MTP10_18350 [Nonomuraea sp. 3-1Str]|uniref:hypothetical protein n=1 Tax=Nonomuraea sp. 3-1Str TaxID=2929801 RepID=UPI002860953C|nr:hypothetical protein [Nonomuraea sp. 3-1Str]MDR8410690.1 hypothetical protein [Nonomuraea sp. 3-1Str]